jgi:hypothetical protein
MIMEELSVRSKVIDIRLTVSLIIPKSKNTGRFLQENTGNQWNLEAVFLPHPGRFVAPELSAWECLVPHL